MCDDASGIIVDTEFCLHAYNSSTGFGLLATGIA